MSLHKNAKNGAQLKKDGADEITFKFLSDSVLKAFEKDGSKFCRLTASSNGEDLVGDIMSSKALEQMRDAAVGTVMFMNHSTNVPEDVFGTVVEATLDFKSADLVGGGQSDLYCLDYLVEVQEDNERALKTWTMIQKGTKLGASVTVLVRDKSPNPKRNKGIVIEEVEYLETSIVGIPCNRQSWVSAAKKALDLAEQRSAKTQEPEAPSPDDTPAIENGETENMSTNVPAAPAVENETTDITKFFPLTIAAITAAKAVREQIAKGETVTLPESVADVVQKGMFNDILAQAPTFWDLCDILCSVRWKLMYQIDNLKYVGSTDFSAIQAAWSEALDEFKAAQITSFNYWQKIDIEAGGDDGDDILSSSLELGKSFESLSDLFSKTADETVRGQLRETGTSMLVVAKQMGLILPDSGTAPVQIPEITDESIEKSAKFTELETKLAVAETTTEEQRKQIEELTQNYEIAKAGLTAANEALGQYLRQPLALSAQGTPATS